MITTTGDTKQNIVKLTVKALHHEHHFYILEQPPYHFAPQQIQEQNRRVRTFYLSFNFHVQFTEKSVDSLWFFYNISHFPFLFLSNFLFICWFLLLFCFFHIYFHFI